MKRTGLKCRATVSRPGGKTVGVNGSVELVARKKTERGEGKGGKQASNERGGGELLFQQTTATNSTKQTSLTPEQT